MPHDVRRTAAQALADGDRPDVTTALLNRLTDKNPDVRRTAAQALAGRDTPDVTTALLNRLTDEDEKVRCAAVKALAGQDDVEVTRALLDRLAHDNEESVRDAAERVLSEARSPRALVVAANEISALPQSCWQTLTEVLRQLMLKHYLQLPLGERAAVRATISELSATKEP